MRPLRGYLLGGEKVVKCQKWDLRLIFQAGDPALFTVSCLDIYGKTVFRFLL